MKFTELEPNSFKRQERKTCKLAIFIGMKLQIGSCVTFCDVLSGSAKYIGIVISIMEIMHINVAEVLWSDGTITTTSIDSLRVL